MAFTHKIRRKCVFSFISLIQWVRTSIWRLCATADVRGRPHLTQPTLLAGAGRIEFGQGVRVGYFPSPDFLTGSCHIEARDRDAVVRIGDHTTLNNSFVAVAEGTRIDIGRRCLIGPRVTIFDSDFHAIKTEDRAAGIRSMQAPVIIGDDVFIGAGVIILKGVRVGDQAVIAAGSVVIKDVPPGTIAAGNPATVVKRI